jgi:hypothetical protein
MKICSKCGRQIEDNDLEPGNPAEILGDLFHEVVSQVDDTDICQACKEELGMLSMLGFGE